MANTRDVIGDQETVDALVANTLTGLEEDGVTSLGQYALYNRTALESVSFPNLLTSGNYSHSGCTGLTSVSMPSLTTLSQYTFQNCKALENISLPVAAIGNYAFVNCERLKTVTDANLTGINQYAFQGCYELSEVPTSGVTTIGNYAFDSSGLGELVLPVCTSLGTYTGKGQRMSLIDLTNNITIAANKFNGANALTHLILRSSTMCTLSGTSAFTGTPIAAGIGWIYVPADLVNTYKAASNWTNYASQIVPISEYPKALQDETISDSWSDIFDSIDGGTYATDYSVGDIKYLNIGGTTLAMQIVAFNADTKTGGGTAPITWIARDLLQSHRMNPTDVTTNGWAGSDMRRFLREVIYPQIDPTVKSRILAVDKTYKDVTTGSTLTASDTVWIPSNREVQGGTTREASGVDYTAFFTNNEARIKKYGISGSANGWWLRSACSSTSFDCVSNYGAVYSYNANNTYGVALGFCT